MPVYHRHLRSKLQSALLACLQELQNRKLELTNELRLLEKGAKALKDNNNLPIGALPNGTTVSYTLEADIAAGSVISN